MEQSVSYENFADIREQTNMLEARKWQTIGQRVAARTLQVIFTIKYGWLPKYVLGRFFAVWKKFYK